MRARAGDPDTFEPRVRLDRVETHERISSVYNRDEKNSLNISIMLIE